MGTKRPVRARYQDDLEFARQNGIPNISHIGRADGEGEFVFTFNHELLPSQSDLEIQLVPQEFSSYPVEHCFLVFAISDVPVYLSRILDNFMTASFGIKVEEALGNLSRSLATALERSSIATTGYDGEDTFMSDVDDEEHPDDFDNDSDDLDISYLNNDDDLFGLGNGHSQTQSSHLTRPVTPQILDRIRRDFRAVRNSGFKVARLCGFDEVVESNIMSISVRVDKLCLSVETRAAWNMSLEDYVVLLIRYANSYTTLEDAVERVAGQSNMQFRLRKCTKYKPTVHDAVKAFAPTDPKYGPRPSMNSADDNELTMLGIGQSIDTFMDTEFIPLVKLKHARGYSWDRAKKEYAEMAKAIGHLKMSSDDIRPDRAEPPLDSGQDDDSLKLPQFLTKDTLASKDEISLPLVAAQFAMRYLVRCTDYCMVCHQQVEGNFEALKPYVCDNSLCLFQYMSMGFGPSIDHEIIHQPNVVDLLISFCYSALSKDGSVGGVGIREYPTGLSLQVPDIRSTATNPDILAMHRYGIPANPADVQVAAASPPTAQSVQLAGTYFVDPISGVFDLEHYSFVWDEAPAHSRKLVEGKWVVVAHSGKNTGVGSVMMHHARIENIVGANVSLRVAATHQYPMTQTSDGQDCDGPVQSHMVPYSQNLDDLDNAAKTFSMKLLLATVPSVQEMKTFLTSNGTGQLEKWDRLTPYASKLLRWIVASNRSFIVQVDAAAEANEASAARANETVSGVPGWLQFRFAQGSPEKEMLFRAELEKVNKPQRTLVAWHGSSLANWHSIIRTGLNFQRTLNGRAYGDGVYFSRDFSYSESYSNDQYRVPTTGGSSSRWPNSALDVGAAISLNELVNRPQEFVCANSILVVQHIHWIQCRYLFVKPMTSAASAASAAPVTPAPSKRSDPEFEQDPQYPSMGPRGQKLFIPLVAIPSAQGDNTKKSSGSAGETASGHCEDSEDDEDEEDIKFLSAYMEDEESTASHTAYDLSNTDFCPGTLDVSTLPKLDPPSWATGTARKTIMREITSLKKIQSSRPLSEAGWFIDFDNIAENMFHWIVELHSFDASLPLAQDMKKAKITSIVLEFRFGPSYPLSPPFVRVIRPRFIPFMSGGGGHVTSGGAMCMELLTNSGWSPVSSLESVLLQVRLALCTTEPKPARLENHISPNRMDYGIGEAVDAYRRAASTHGWEIPSDLVQTTAGFI